MPPSDPDSRRVTLLTTDDREEAYRVLRRARYDHPRGNYDLLTVRLANPPVRTRHRYAVVRYDD